MGTSTNEARYNVIAVVVILNVIASLLTLLVIAFMRRNGTLRVNLYIKCVILMSFWQVIGDYFTLPLNSCFGNAPPSKTSFAGALQAEDNIPLDCTIAVFGFGIGGYGSAIWSLMMVVAAAFTVEMGRKPSYREEIIALVSTNVLILPHCIFFARSAYYSATNRQEFNHQLEIYNVARLVLIVISILVICRMYCVLRKVSVAGQRKSSPMYHLLRKIVYYPIVQCVCRFSVTAYFWGYSGNSNFSGLGGWQTFWLYVVFIFLPSAGIGDFLVFLRIQKSAKAELKRMICLEFSVEPTIEKQETEKQDRNRTSKSKRLSARKNNDKCGGLSTREEHVEGHEEGEEEYEEQNTDGDSWHQATRSTSPKTVDYDYDYNSIISRLSSMDEDELLDEYFLNRSTMSSRQSGQSFGAVQSAGLSASLSRASDGMVSTPLSASIVELGAVGNDQL